jgi:radical SAM protein with 4Fe4S-binding SPASM domain
MMDGVVPVPIATTLYRRAALVLRLAETWVHRPPSPTRAVVDLTRRCNLRCRMCRTWEVPAGAELSAAELGALVRDMPRLCWLDLTGGEPTLRRDFCDVLSAIAREGRALHVLHFQTNGWSARRALEAARTWRAARPEVDLVITVSIDGPKAVHDRMRGREGSYERAIRTLRALRDEPGVDVHVGTTITADNVAEIDALGEQLARDVPGFDPSRWHVNVAHRSAHFFANAEVWSALAVDGAEVVRRHVARRGIPRDLVALMEQVYLVNLAAVATGEPSGVPCQALRSTVFVSPEGEVYPCHLWDRPLGNVRRTPFAEIWRAAEVERARREVIELRCGGCFSACEAYPALAGAPLRAAVVTLRRALSPPPAKRAPSHPRTRLPVLSS